jgi:hypothetical protein
VPLAAPVALSPAHDCAAFDCGDDGLNAWLRKQAQKSEAAHGSRCFVVCGYLVLVDQRSGIR